MGLLDFTATAATGLAGVADQMRQRKLDEEQRQHALMLEQQQLARQTRLDALTQQEHDAKMADVQRSIAKENLQAAQERAQGLLASKQGGLAAAMLPEITGLYNQVHGTNYVGSPVHGVPTFQPIMGPAPGPYRPGHAPMVKVGEDRSHPIGLRYDSPETVAAIRSGLMLGAPKLEARPAGSSLTDEWGNVVATIPQKQPSLQHIDIMGSDGQRHIGIVNPLTGTVQDTGIVAGGQASINAAGARQANAIAHRAAPKPRMGWVPDGHGGAVWGEMVAGTGKPTTANKPMTYKEALETAWKEGGGDPRFAPPAVRQERAARAKQLMAQGSGQPSALQRLAAQMEAERKNRGH